MKTNLLSLKVDDHLSKQTEQMYFKASHWHWPSKEISAAKKYF
jgi:hypothetical protein